MLAVMLLAEQAGLSQQDVVQEYRKESMERRAVVYDVLGRTELSQHFLDSFPSQFMLHGYQFEEELLKANQSSVQKPPSVQTASKPPATSSSNLTSASKS